VHNPSKTESVDLSGWKLIAEADGKEHEPFVFEPGTVLPPSARLYVAEDVYDLRSSGRVPRGVMVVGPLKWFGGSHINDTTFFLR